MTSDILDELASRAFLYGFPLVFNLDQVRRYTTTGVGANHAAPFNAFSHARTLATSDDTFVSINNDTVYSIAQIDVSSGPLMLEVPDTAGRYYVLQFISAWTENFAYVGKRGMGTGRATYLIVGPEWDGDVPPAMADAVVIRCPTEIASIGGRWAVGGESDLINVIGLQEETLLAQLNPAVVPGLPTVDTDSLGDELAFWERYRVFSQSYPPPARDQTMQDGFAPLGLTGSTPVLDLDDERRTVLVNAYRRGMVGMQQILSADRGDQNNGWGTSLHAFDHNLDHLEVGTRDESRWKIIDPDERILVRAGAAMAGLWGCHAYEAVYFTVYRDEDGQSLTGEYAYELTLDPPPPTDAFWSLTMYDVPDFHLVPNMIDRYSIGDRTPGLVSGSDGEITISISRSAPATEAQRTNWLPAPVGAFRPLLRVYLPGEPLLDGTYTLPPIRRMK